MRRSRRFTLIEILVVVVILAILGTLVIVLAALQLIPHPDAT